MILHKLLMTAVIVTSLAVIYVHQQIEIVKAGYELQQARNELSELQENYARLQYDLSRLESPRNLLSSMQGTRIQFARRRDVTREHIASIQIHEGREGAFFERFIDAFTVTAEALSGR